MIKASLCAGALLGLMSTGAMAQYYSVPDMSHGYPLGTGAPVLSEKDAQGAVVVEDNVAGGVHPHAQLPPVEQATDSQPAGMSATTANGQPAAATAAGAAAPTGQAAEKRDLGIPMEPVEGAPGYLQPYSPGQVDPLGTQAVPVAP